MERQYFVHLNGQQQGPLSLKAVRELPLNSATLIWYEGLTGWVAANTLDEFKDLFKTVPVVPVPDQPGTEGGGQVPPPPQDKRANVTGTIPGWTSNAQLSREIDKHYRNVIVFLITSIAGIFVASLITFILADMSDGLGIAAAWLGGLTVLALIIACIVSFCKFHYRCWAVANARTGSTETTPGSAVGLLFIPFFNLYWNFRSYHDLSRLLGHAIQPLEYDPGMRPNAGTAQAMCILRVCGIIPYLGFLASLVALILWFIVIAENRKAATHLLREPA